MNIYKNILQQISQKFLQIFRRNDVQEYYKLVMKKNIIQRINFEKSHLV
jgi:hypothetical protein